MQHISWTVTLFCVWDIAAKFSCSQRERMINADIQTESHESGLCCSLIDEMTSVEYFNNLFILATILNTLETN